MANVAEGYGNHGKYRQDLDHIDVNIQDQIRLYLVDTITGSQQHGGLKPERNLVATAGRASRTNSGVLGYGSIFDSFRFGQSQSATYIDIFEIRM